MFDNIREDYRVHGRSLRNRAFWAMVTYRFGRWSMNSRPYVLRWLTGKIYGAMYICTGIVTCIHMPREVTLGKRFHIVHAEGSLSIHPDTVIGDDVGVMHNVTIGTNMSTGVPTIGDNVFIGVGAAVLGGVKVGDGARIAANSLVISDVPPGSVAMGVPARVWKNFSGVSLASSEKGFVDVTTPSPASQPGGSSNIP